MNTLKKFIILVFLSLSLLACDDKGKAVPQAQEEVYDFRNEKYQDFYSRFMREVERRNDGSINANDSFDKSFDNKFIKESLGIEHQGHILFKLIIYRVKPEENKANKAINHFKDENDIFEFKRNHRLDKLSDYQICGNNLQINGLFCFDKINDTNREYYYIPTKSQNKIPYINQSIKFYCENVQGTEKKYVNCTLLSFPDNPYNLDIWISFDNPNDFFHIIEYVEKYIHNATGEHIWQTSLNKN